jgi:ribosomal protein S18 acetylase RimI-like enzyme
MEYRLRPAAEADVPWLEQLRRSVYQELFVATFGAWDEARHLRHCAECWARGGISLIEVRGERVGMIQLCEQPAELEIAEIQLLSAQQGHGLGTRLLRAVLAQAHAQGQRVWLSVGLKNERAHQLYRRLGFEDIAASETHFHMACPPARDVVRR